MSIDISGFGGLITVQTTFTFPEPVPFTQFPDDQPPFDFESIEIAEMVMGNNGDGVKWSKAVVIKMGINLIPYSTDDTTMSVLLENNRVGKGKFSAKDSITLNIFYSNGRFKTLSGGSILAGKPAPGWESSGRLTTKDFKFGFENITGS
jgi:hypothetical protein